MKTSNHGRKFIEIEEGRALFDSNSGLYFPYRDSIGKLTIGVGHLIRSDEDFSRGITSERVDQLLAADLIKCDVAIDGIKAKRPLGQNQHDCLASWLFNVGTGWATIPGRSSVVRFIELGEYDRIPELLLLYDMADGKHQPYLKARRRREGALWMLPDDKPLDDIYAAADKAAALRFPAIELAREADDDARISIEWDDETPTDPLRKL